VWTADPAWAVPPRAGRTGRPRTKVRSRPDAAPAQAVREIVRDLPAGDWIRHRVTEGEKGPREYEFAKSGTGYVLRQGELGGIGGEVASAPVCPAFGGTAQSGATLYVPCTSGLAQVQVSASGSIRVAWQSASGANGPPVVGGGTVWSIDLARGELVALAPSTGQPLAHLAVGPVLHFASPTLWNGQVFVGTDSGVTAIDAR